MARLGRDGLGSSRLGGSWQGQSGRGFINSDGLCLGSIPKAVLWLGLTCLGWARLVPTVQFKAGRFKAWF